MSAPETSTEDIDNLEYDATLLTVQFVNFNETEALRSAWKIKIRNLTRIK